MDFSRYVAVGDSLTEGKGDSHPDGTLRGFADLLATSVDADYANLARASVRTAEIHQDQVPAAARLDPHLVTVVVGVNDIIAARMDRQALTEAVDALMTDLRSRLPEAVIATATLPDLGSISAVARLWRGRVSDLNAMVRASASANDVVVVGLDSGPPLTLQDLALDRVHPSPQGHLRFATAFADALALPRPQASFMDNPIRMRAVNRAYRTAVTAPHFVARRLARGRFIAGQPPKRPDLRRV